MSTDNTHDTDENEPIAQECAITHNIMNVEDMVRVPSTAMNNYYHQRNEHSRSMNIAPSYSEEGDFWAWVDASIERGYCDDCGGLYDQNDSDANEAVGACAVCAQDYAFCERHEIHYRMGDDYCSYCDEEEGYDEDSGLVHDYSYRPSPSFYQIATTGFPRTSSSEPRRTAVTGFELEMEASECDSYDGASLATELYDGVAYLKHDGSLNNGFEMVTHPMTIDYINKYFNFDGLKRLADLGMRSASTSTCGLHVHINKGYFNNRATSLYRFMSLFYRNEAQWKRIAGRSRSSYAQWNDDEHHKMIDYVKTMKGDNYGRYNYDRYVAINLQPSNTIELRFFKGTLRPESLKARLQAVHAAAEYSIFTRNIISIAKASEWEAFREWTSKDPDRFGSFNTYATEKGI